MQKEKEELGFSITTNKKAKWWDKLCVQEIKSLGQNKLVS